MLLLPTRVDEQLSDITSTMFLVAKSTKTPAIPDSAGRTYDDDWSDRRRCPRIGASRGKSICSQEMVCLLHVVARGRWEVVGERTGNIVMKALLLVKELVFDAASDSCR